MLRRPSLLVAVIALGLAGCGAPPTSTSGPYTAVGTYAGDPGLLPMAVAVVAVGADLIPSAVDVAATVGDPVRGATELADDQWLVGSAFVGTDGAVRLAFLDAADLPSEALVPVHDAFLGGYAGQVPAGCSVAGDVAAARVTAFGIAAPFLVPYTIGFTPAGTVGVAATTTAVDLLDPGLSAATLVGFVHADRAVRLASTGTCVDGAQDLSVAVDLDAGWNRVTYRLTGIGQATVTVEIQDDDGTALRLQPLAP